MNEHDAEVVLMACSIGEADKESNGNKALNSAIESDDEQNLVRVSKNITAESLATLSNPEIRPVARVSMPLLLPAGCAISVCLGFLSYQLPGTRTISILAPPVLALVAWNLIMYSWLVLASVRNGMSGQVRFPAVLKVFLRWPGQDTAKPDAARIFKSKWLHHAAPLYFLRYRTIMHFHAAFLAAGVVAGLYMRGLAVEYRAGWESTFLDAGSVHALVSLILMPASLISGIPVPSPEVVRGINLSMNPDGGNAAVWIHLYAVTAAAFIILPRLALGIGSAVRASAKSRNFLQPTDLLPKPAKPCKVWDENTEFLILPYCHQPDSVPNAELVRVLSEATGSNASCRFLPVTGYGEEQQSGESLKLQENQRLAFLANIATTPERETVGELLAKASEVPQDDATIYVVLDTGGFHGKFRHDPELLTRRISERLETWKSIAPGERFEFLTLNP